MIDEIYENRMLYYSFMKGFLQEKISPWEFRVKYLNQRDNDLDKNKENGYRDYYLNRVLLGNEKIFENKYADHLYEQGTIELKRYEKGARELNIKGELFFMGLWNLLDIPIIEFYPSNSEGFDPKIDTDEHTLKKMVQAAFDVLERNKDRWEYQEDESMKI